MTRPTIDDPMNLSCSFCGKSQREVRKLIAGPTVYICDECVDVCNEIIADDVVTSPIGEKLPKPHFRQGYASQPACDRNRRRRLDGSVRQSAASLWSQLGKVMG